MAKMTIASLFLFFSMTLSCSEELAKQRMEKFQKTKETNTDFFCYKERRNRLIEKIKTEYPGTKHGALVLFGNFEPDVREFEQERHFFYLTGIKEPGMCLYLDIASGKSILYTPGNIKKRAIWAAVQPVFLQENSAKMLNIDQIIELDSNAEEAFYGPFFEESDYHDLINRLKKIVQGKGKIFSLNPTINRLVSLEQRCMLNQFCKYLPQLPEHIEDITSMLFLMRQVKDGQEICCLKKAVNITIKAHLAAAQAIKDGKTEREIRAVIDGTMLTQSRPGFCSIVPSGKDSVILHKLPDDTVLKDGKLVIIDAGAECPCHRYSGDITRTYPVSGKFTEEQRKIYNIVLEAQQHVIKHAKPGYCFSDDNNPEKSLLHITQNFFNEQGYAQYFIHGVGHHIGLGVHEDCYENPETWRTAPLQEGSVIALEPGLYIPKLGFGIRIESNCIVTENGGVCLDDALPKTAEEIEKLMNRNNND
ncbi:MAG: Xaa-Pro peptidase family protein [Candidatus Babeliales bacterium]